MGIMDMFRRATPPSKPAVSLVTDAGRSVDQSNGALAPVSGVSGATLGFQDGTDGKRSLTWTRHHTPVVSGGYFGTAPGSEISRERAQAAAVTADLLTSNPTVATLIQNFAVLARLRTHPVSTA